MNSHFHLITDADMYRFFEDGKRGGLSFINEHVVVVNDDRTTDFLTCHDVNSLYAEAMSLLIPTHDFEWVKPNILESIDWYNIDMENEDYCYILKVDLHYPQDIHNKTADLPLAPCNENVSWDMLTQEQQKD